jgi:hypothetical protein
MLEGGGIDPADVADQVHDAVVQGRFWVLPHEYVKPIVEERARSIVEETNPGGLPIG